MSGSPTSLGPMTPGSDTTMLGYFRWAFIITALGLALGAVLGWQTTDTLGGMLTIFVVVAVLAVLEISLSFDNAIVNANVLKGMRPEWQRRFLTWGILIAVFGMRIVFPLLIVVIAAGVGPWQALVLAAVDPDAYARIMHEAHLPIAAFGGTFLMMVGLSFFFDHEKDVLTTRRTCIGWAGWSVGWPAPRPSAGSRLRSCWRSCWASRACCLRRSRSLSSWPRSGACSRSCWSRWRVACSMPPTRRWQRRPRAGWARFFTSKCWMRPSVSMG